MKFLNNDRATPYPTIQTILREIAVALDTKSYLSGKEAKKLDDCCSKRIDLYIGELHALKNLTVISPIKCVYGEELAARIDIFLNTLVSKYFSWIEEHPLDGISVQQANQLFIQTKFFPKLITSCFLDVDIYGQKLCLPNSIPLILLEDTCADSLTDLMESKEAKDRVRLWRANKENPSFKYVASIEQHAPSAQKTLEQWVDLKWGIIASRFIRTISQDEKYQTLPKSNDISLVFKQFHSCNSVNFQAIKLIIEAILLEYRNTAISVKTNKNREVVESLLAMLKTEVNKIAPELNVSYAYHQLYARHLVLAGDLKEANAEYKKAFESSLYSAHSKAQIQIVIQEALKVAAYQTSPDRVFITRLKSVAILLGLEQLPAKTKLEGKNKLQVINDNEIDAYRAEFLGLFPEEFAYPNVIYPKYPKKVGFLFEGFDHKKNDIYKKKIKIGMEGGLKRSTTPMIEAATRNDVETVEKLLNTGVSVNVISEVGDSPLLMALSQLDFQTPGTPMDVRLFNLISEHPHSDKILNTISTRKKRTPLNAAVDTGEPSIVKKVLSMSLGIQVDLQAGLDNMTPLYQAICLIGLVKNPSNMEEKIFHNPSAETIHRLKPLMAGIFPTSDIKIKEVLLSLNNSSKHHKNIRDVWSKVFIENFIQRMPSPAKLRQIARVLIKKGANVNFEHNINAMNYTPLMLAAEMNEIQLFKFMIDHGGDWRKTYTLPIGQHFDKKAINSLDIARYYCSKDIAQFIENELM